MQHLAIAGAAIDHHCAAGQRAQLAAQGTPQRPGLGEQPCRNRSVELSRRAEQPLEHAADACRIGELRGIPERSVKALGIGHLEEAHYAIGLRVVTTIDLFVVGLPLGDVAFDELRQRNPLPGFDHAAATIELVPIVRNAQAIDAIDLGQRALGDHV